MKGTFLILLMIYSISANAMPVDDALFKKANINYTEMQYENACEQYLQLLKTNTTSHSIYYNCGNCMLKLKRYGKAIWCYKKALMLKPNDNASLQNMKIALHQCNGLLQKNGTNSSQFLYQFAMLFNNNLLAILMILTISISAICFSFYILKPQNNISKKVSKASLIIVSICIVIMISKSIISKQISECIVLNNANVYQQKNGNQVISTINQGNSIIIYNRYLKLKSEEQRIFIQLPNGNSGWIDYEYSGIVQL